MKLIMKIPIKQFKMPMKLIMKITIKNMQWKTAMKWIWMITMSVLKNHKITLRKHLLIINT